MNERADAPLPDEIETLEALTEAAAVLNGDLRPADGGGWELRLPGVSALAVSATDTAAFPLALVTPRGRLALPACADATEELVDPLRVAVLRQELQPADLALALQEPPAGWQIVSCAAGRIELARTDQTARGWPATAEVTAASGVAIVETTQPVAIGNGAARAAVAHLLTTCSSWPCHTGQGDAQGLVEVYEKPDTDNASRTTSAPDPDARIICYRLATPAIVLTPARLTDALALVGLCYRNLTPAINALAEHPALAETYLTLQRRSK